MKLPRVMQVAPVTLGLIVINVLIFGIVYLRADSTDDARFNYFLFDSGALFNPFTLDGEWYRILMHMFLHGFVLHLVFNMYGLFSVGTPLEASMGSLKFAIVYFLSGLAGAYSTLYFSLFTFSVGASGAIFGLFGFSLVLNVVDTIESGGSIKWMVINFIFFLIVYFFIAQQYNVDHAGHVGGLFFGLIAALVEVFRKQERTWIGFVGPCIPVMIVLFFLLPRDQVRYYEFFSLVMDAERDGKELFAKKGLSDNQILLNFKSNKRLWDSAAASLDSLPFVRPELREDTFKLRRYISLRSLVQEYRLRMYKDETFILMDSIEHAEDSVKNFLQLTYVLPQRREPTSVVATAPEEQHEPPKLSRVAFDSNWVETNGFGVYYRLGFKDSLDQWNGWIRDYYSDGTIQMKGFYSNDQRDGIFLYYSKHNTYTAAGRYVENNRIGKWQTFHNNGKLASEIYYNQGYYLNNVWDSAGVQQVVNGNGKVTEYFSTGRIKTEGIIANGRRHGTWRGYLPDGKLHYREEYDNGMLVQGRSMDNRGNTFVYDHSTFFPVPEHGAEHLRQLLNMKAQQLDRPQLGTVLVSFRVTRDGLLTDFEFDKSVTHEVKTIVKNLVLENTQWVPAREHGYKNIDGFAELKIEF